MVGVNLLSRCVYDSTVEFIGLTLVFFHAIAGAALSAAAYTTIAPLA